MARKKSSTKDITPTARRKCKECDAPITGTGVYEGGILGNLDDISDEDRYRVAMWCMVLASYCMMQNDANARAFSGDMELARRIRQEADDVFNTLPRFLRW